MSASTDIRIYEGSASSENVTFHPVTEGFVGQQTFNQDDKNLLGSPPGKLPSLWLLRTTKHFVPNHPTME
ncbi:hypothetical protein CBI33_07625 [Rhodococcus erythropolis]|nr:hypothetical protein CBI33_07625 [Rhodococcus erythropolis]